MPFRATIMVVDDDDSVRFVVKRFLTEAGYHVLECADGDEALARIGQRPPSVILLDVKMPRQNGYAVLKELRERGCRIPVLMLTEASDVSSRIEGLESGADDYLGKPCDFKELLARVKALLRRSAPAGVTPGTLVFGDLVVDLESRSATRGAVGVNLTRTEYLLLDLLAGHPGKPVSREQMIAAVWGFGHPSGSNTLDTTLWRLRRKLGDDARDPKWLRNLPGIGYVLECDARPPAESNEMPALPAFSN